MLLTEYDEQAHIESEKKLREKKVKTCWQPLLPVL